MSRPGDPVLILDGITLAFGTDAARETILERFDLVLRPGEFVSVLGPSGVGKSTLLRVAAGLIRPHAGTVRRPADRPPGRRGTALVFQDARLLPWRRAWQNVAFGLEGLGLDRRERRDRAMAALGSVGLEALADRFPGQLSGGQRQRVGVARALAVRPDLLLMDEPFGALDAITRTGLQDALGKVRRSRDQTILFVTHDIEEALHLSDRVVVLAGSPARVRGEIAIPDHARDRDDPALSARAAQVRAMLAP